MKRLVLLLALFSVAVLPVIAGCKADEKKPAPPAGDSKEKAPDKEHKAEEKK